MSSSSETEKRRIGPFELEDRLGVGGMGIVYRATYTKTGQKVAVKVLAPDLTADAKVAKRFEREMEILKRLKHPHIVQYYGGSTSGSQRYYAMEYVTGGSLDRVIRKKGRLSWEEALDYGLQIARALEHAHNAGIIHRDLKPGNLLLTAKGVLKLSDFGIARDTQATQLTAAGKTVGTMAYMAPEQITGKHPVSRKTDLYALGCVLFEILTGRTPFQAETQPELLFKHVEEEPPRARELNIDVPLWLDRLIAELLEKEPDDRPFDALAVQVKLEEVRQKVAQRESLVGQTIQGGDAAVTAKDRDPTLERLLGPRKKKKRRKRGDVPIWERTWFLGLALVLIAGLVTWAAWPEGEEAIYRRAQEIMASADESSWYRAEPDVDKLLVRFPDGRRADEARQWKDQIEMYSAERSADRNVRLGRDPQSEAERLFVEARQFERFGDRLTALDKYESMAVLLRDDPAARPFLNLARRRATEIKATAGGASDRMAFVAGQLEQGDRMYLDGRQPSAKDKWQSIVRLYGNNPEFDSLVQRARERLIDPAEALRAERAAAASGGRQE